MRRWRHLQQQEREGQGQQAKEMGRVTCAIAATQRPKLSPCASRYTSRQPGNRGWWTGLHGGGMEGWRQAGRQAGKEVRALPSAPNHHQAPNHPCHATPRLPASPLNAWCCCAGGALRGPGWPGAAERTTTVLSEPNMLCTDPMTSWYTPVRKRAR